MLQSNLRWAQWLGPKVWPVWCPVLQQWLLNQGKEERGCAHKPQTNPERGKASPHRQGLPGPSKGQGKRDSPTTTVLGRTCCRDQWSPPNTFCIFHRNGYKLTKCSVSCVSNAYVSRTKGGPKHLTRVKGSPNSAYLRCHHHWSLRQPRSSLDGNERRDTVNSPGHLKLLFPLG